MRLLELVLVGIIGLLLFLIVTPSDTYSQEKGLVWIGLGEAEGKYQEDEYNIEEEVTGSTFEYNEFEYKTYKNHRSLIKSSQGATKSFFFQYILFDPIFEDEQDRTHSLSFTELIPHWSRGYTYILHMGSKLDWVNSAELFAGIGFITFEKEIENLYKFDYKWGFDLSYGYGLNSIFKYDDKWFFGWRSLVKNNRITLEYNQNSGYLTHRRDIMLVFGGTFSGSAPSCVPTAYVQCP